MNAFPAYYPLAGRTVVIAGDGERAEAKARLFEGSPARLVRLGREASLDPTAYAGAALVFIADADRTFQEAARAAARLAGAPVNVVDRLDLCDFTTPALIDRGELVIAVGTAGAAPLLASALRGDIEARVPEGVGQLAALLHALRDEVRAAFPDLAARRAFLREALSSPAADAAMAGEMAKAQQLLRQAMTAGAMSAPAGSICILDHAGPIDLISLRAARRLTQADVLVLGPAAQADIVALARRDARRLDARNADLASLARDGLKVVVFPPPTEAEVGVLRAAGLPVEILSSGDGLRRDR